LKDLLDKFSRFTNSLVYDGGICKRLYCYNFFNNVMSFKDYIMYHKEIFILFIKNIYVKFI
ncbi:hypothetical protein, partial [Aliarcobacter butzleri]|uniref:hypothetical protein n=1 Tax=Aliarcobacter butzleri TaxID=28197 RepID=UPI001D01BE3B